MLMRYVGPEPEVMLSVSGNVISLVKQGEAVAIDDKLARSVEWPPALWEIDTGNADSKDTPADDSADDDTADDESAFMESASSGEDN